MAAVFATSQIDHGADSDRTRQAYNSAFDELGLPWYWDRATCATLPPGREGLRAYIEREHPHLLRAYEPGFLVEAIETARSRCESVLRRH